MPLPSAEGDLIYIPDMEGRAVGNLLQQFVKPRITALTESLGFGAQCEEDEQFGLLVSTTLSASTGASLDQWGAFVGEERGALDDADYRVFIDARILANNSLGTTDDLIVIFQKITAPSIVEHTNLFPACFQMVALRNEFMDSARARRVGTLMEEIKPAGVCMIISQAIVGSFGFAGNPDAQPLDVGPFASLL